MNNEEQEQEWKNVLHPTIKNICNEMKETYDASFNFDFVAALTELAFRQIKSFAEDLELFARHGKRNVINTDDIKLLVRKSPALFDFMEEKISENAKNKEKENQSKKKKAVAVPETSDAASTSAPKETKKKKRGKK